MGDHKGLTDDEMGFLRQVHKGLTDDEMGFLRQLHSYGRDSLEYPNDAPFPTAARLVEWGLVTTAVVMASKPPAHVYRLEPAGRAVVLSCIHHALASW